jgi:hypothetical protein
MRILYLSCHSILEYDEVKLFHELGHQVFSPGAYIEPAKPGDSSLRPGIPGLVYDPDMVELWNRHEAKRPSVNGKEYIFETPEIMDHFDAIIVMHLPQFIIPNWDIFKGKRVIWRTIGQSIANTEKQMAPYRARGMEIVRYSPREHTIPGYIGADTVIRFYKDPDEYGPWVGTTKRVITFGQHMKARDSACNFTLFDQCTRLFPRHLFGPGNDGIGDWTTGKVPFEQLKEEMRMNRCYFYTGTHPASYTLNFMEAWMSGIPIVAIGHKHGNASYFPGHHLYEIPDLMQSHMNGFISDDPRELSSYIKLLLNNDSIAAAISANGRRSAIKHFGKDTIKAQWKAYLR